MHWRRLGISAGVFFLFLAAYCLWPSYEISLFSPRWDIFHYLSIAHEGYRLFPCGEELERAGIHICGNPWYPGWPYFMRIFSGWPFSDALGWFVAVAITLAFASFFLFCSFTPSFVKDSDAKTTPYLALAVWALFPNSFFLITAFPYAFVTCLTLLYWGLFYQKEKCRSAGVPTLRQDLLLFFIAVWIALSYPSAALAAIVPNLFILRDPARAWSRRLLHCLGASLPFVLGNLWVCLIFYFKFNDFWLFFSHSRQYSRTGANPAQIIWRALGEFGSAEYWTLIWFGLALILFAERKMRLRLEIYAYLVAVFLFSPLTGTVMSIYRHYVLMFPLALLIASSTRPLVIKLLYAGFGIYLAVQIFLPAYLEGRLI